MTIVVGWPACEPGTMFAMNSSGYAARVFSVLASESRSSRRVAGSQTTFSSTVPKRCEAAQISGSAFCDRRIAFA